MNKQEIDKFLQDVEREKEFLSKKCGWQVQPDGLIMRAVNIINALSGKCKDCKFWKTVKQMEWDDNGKACMCPKILGNVDGMNRKNAEDKEVLACATACCQGGNLMTRPDFGCVCFETKSEPEKQENE